MYLNISTLKAIYFSTKIINDEIREHIRPFFDLKNLFQESIISFLYVLNRTVFLSKDQIDHIFNQIFLNTGIQLNFKDIEQYLEFHDDIQCIEITNYNKWKKSFLKESTVIYNGEFTYRNVKKVEIPFTIDNKKLVSIDFEFRQLGNSITPLEIGITTFENDVIGNYHYAVKERFQKNNFKFGESILFEPSEFENILNLHLNDANYIVGHSLESEFKTLISNKYCLNIFEEKDIIDTSFALKKEFKIKNIDPKFTNNNNQISLKNALTSFKIEFENLHNAGNDAAYVILLLKKMISVKKEAYLKNPERKARIIIKD